jgi:general secretion pathway protein J
VTLAAVRSNCDGFSLLEMLVAMTLFGLVAVLLFGGLHIGTRVLETGGRHSEQASRLAVAFGFMRAQLAQAQPIERATAERIEGKKLIEFDGSEDGLAFIGPTSAYQPVGGLQVLAIRREQQAGVSRLIADWRPYQTTTGNAADVDPRRTVLFDDIAGVELAYFGASAPKEKPTWRREWRDQTALPNLVQMRVRFRDGRTTPDLFVALKLAAAR